MCDLDKKFNEIAVENFKIKLNCEECPDQFIGTVEYNGTNFQWKEKKVVILNDEGKKLKGKELKTEREKYNEKIKNLPIITIVLESPHKDEFYFENNKIKPIGPACGNTGTNIDGNLCEVLNKIEDEDKSSLKGKTCLIKLVNAIQYPCSLFAPTEFFRTDNFSSCWKNEFIDDFKERLHKNNNDIIINCCTKGDEEANLKGKVGEVLEKEFKEIPLYECSHPSSWTKPENRKLTKI